MADSVDEGLTMLLEGGAPPSGLSGGASGVRGVGLETSGQEGMQFIEDAVDGLDEALKELQEAVERLRESLNEDPQ